MISFFRKIRQKLLSQNRVTRYLVYAIGEIFLVVIGILIALQVNTWNEQLKNRKKEKLILQDLHVEFLKNKENLQATIQHHEAILGSTKQLMNFFNEPESILETYDLDSLIERSLDYKDFRASQSVIEDLISSGNLNLISSETLRLLIFEWGSEVEEMNESYETMDEVSQNLFLAYLTKNASMKNIDRYGFLKWEEKSKFNLENSRLFKELEFENNIDNQAWGIANYMRALNDLQELTEKIILETKPYAVAEK